MPEPENTATPRVSRWAIGILAGALAIGAAAADSKGLGGFAPSAPPATSSAQTFDGITVDELEQVVKGAGYESKRLPHTDQATVDALEITNKAGYRYDLYLSDCPASGELRCASVNIWSVSFKENPNITLKSLNDFNKKSWGVRAMLFDDGSSGICMNLGVDGGTSVKWILSRMTNFDTWIGIYSEFVNSGLIDGKPL